MAFGSKTTALIDHSRVVTVFDREGCLDFCAEDLGTILRLPADQFGMIDQSRLLRPIDLRFKLPNAIRFVERYEEKEKGEDASKPAAPRRKMRRLGEQDIERVVEVNQQIGTQSFAKVFVRHQKMVEILPGGPPRDVMREYFVGMDALKSHVFLDVELRFGEHRHLLRIIGLSQSHCGRCDGACGNHCGKGNHTFHRGLPVLHGPQLAPRLKR